MSRRAQLVLALVPTLAGLISGGVWAARAQTPPVATQQTPPTTAAPGLLEQLLQGLFPTPTAPPPTTVAPSAAPAPSTSPGPVPDQGPAGAETTERTIPPEAQAIINSVNRSGSNNNLALLEALRPLTDFGLSEEEAALIGMGQFPVAGEAYWSDDWYMPRFTPEFHLHQGTDIFAARGTPVRAPVDGWVEFSSGGAGGLGATVTSSDGTFYYMAHLDSFPRDLRNGAQVKQGEVVGFVGSSGNAEGGSPHVHFEIHPRGGGPVNPKSTVDRWLSEAIARVPEVLASYRTSGLPRPLTAAGILRRLDVGSLGGPSSFDGPQLWSSLGRRENGAVRVGSVGLLGSSVPRDPMARGAQAEAIDRLRAQQMARDVLTPLTPPVLAAVTPGSS